MSSPTSWLIAHGRIARRRDLLAAGFSDHRIRAALARGTIFRIRHGWYGDPALDSRVSEVVRVGGRVTGVSALRLRGLFLPRPAQLDIAVPRNAARLRDRRNFRRRLEPGGIRIQWIDTPRGRRAPHDWIATDDEAFAVILRTGDRELVVAAADGLVRYRDWTADRLDAAFSAAPKCTLAWRRDVDGLADSWGESILRVRLRDAGLPVEPQAHVPGAGPFDARVGARVYVEVDGAQHAEEWTGSDPSSFERDRLKDLVVASLGGRVVRIPYSQLIGDWALCLSAIQRAVAEDLAALSAQASRSRASPQRRRSSRPAEETRAVDRAPRGSPSFS